MSDETGMTVGPTSFPDKVRSNAAFLRACYRELSEAEAEAIAKKLEECAALLEAPRPEEERAIERDARRYRWLRDSSLGQYTDPIAVSQNRVERGMQYVGPLVGEPLDKAIDAAIERRVPQKGEG